jgi:hypothetical protein
MIFQIFSQKNRRKNGDFDSKTKLNYEKNDQNIGYWEKRHFFRRKLVNIVIITSAPVKALFGRVGWGANPGSFDVLSFIFHHSSAEP